MDPSSSTTTMLERIHKKGATVNIVTLGEQEKLDDDDPLKPLDFPFDDAWSKVEQKKKSRKSKGCRASVTTVIENEIAESLKEVSVGIN